MRNFQHLDAVSLKAFYYAAEAENFTRAAELAGLTQSGISQHVARLEEELGVSLFQRVGRKVHLTEAGLKLKGYAEAYIDQVETLVESMKGFTSELQGLVRYAMPASCLMTPHFPMLLKAREDFPKIDLQVHICHSEEVMERLLTGDIDFGFITRNLPHRDVEALEFAREEYVLVGKDRKLVENLEAKNLVELPLVNYPGLDALLDVWCGDHFPRRAPLTTRQFRIAGEVNDLKSAITMVEHGIGVSIFPKHCINEGLAKKALHSARVGSRESSTYPIYLVRLKDKGPLARVEKVITSFWEMKRS